MRIHHPNEGSCGFVCILKHANCTLFDTESEDQTGIYEMEQAPWQPFPSLRGFSNLQVRIRMFIPDPDFFPSRISGQTTTKKRRDKNKSAVLSSESQIRVRNTANLNGTHNAPLKTNVADSDLGSRAFLTNGSGIQKKLFFRIPAIFLRA